MTRKRGKNMKRNDQVVEIVRKQIQTHNPVWISEIFHACPNKEDTLFKMSQLYEKMQDNFHEENYKKEICQIFQLDGKIKTYDFKTILNDTKHAIILSSDEMLPFCYESFWKHIKMYIDQTHIHDYSQLFDDKEIRGFFEDWLYDMDIDLERLDETPLLLNIVEEIKDVIDFTSHNELLNDINCIEKECLDQIGFKEIAC